MMRHLDWKYLHEAAKQLSVEAGKPQTDLLRILKDGMLCAYVQIPVAQPFEVAVSADYWERLGTDDFRVRWKEGGEWKRRAFKIPMKDIKEASEPFLREKLQSIAARSLIAELEPQPAPPDWGALHAQYLERYKLAVRSPRRELDVMLRLTDLDAVIATFVPTKSAPTGGKRGPKKAAEWPDFWEEVIRRLGAARNGTLSFPRKGGGARKAFDADMAKWVEENIAGKLKDGTARHERQRIFSLFQSLGFETGDPAQEEETETNSTEA